MTTRFPLFDGTTLDLEEAWPEPWHSLDRVYKHTFDDGSNPWWLSLETDNGSQSFAGLSSAGGLGTTTLDTGGVSAGDVTNLMTSPVNWDNWDELWFGAIYRGSQIVGDSGSGEFQISLGDNDNANAMTDGIYLRTNDNNQAVDHEVLNGGTSQTLAGGGDDKGEMFGLRIWRNPDNGQTTGHNLRWYHNYEPFAQWSEDGGFPTATEYPLRAGIISPDGSTQTATIETVVLALG